MKKHHLLRELTEIGQQIICAPLVGNDLVEDGYAEKRSRDFTVVNTQGGSAMVIEEYFATAKAVHYAAKLNEAAFQEGDFVPPDEGDTAQAEGGATTAPDPEAEDGIEF